MDRSIDKVRKKNILDQNRFISAMGYRFTPDINIQFGYLNQMVFKADGDRRAHV